MIGWSGSPSWKATITSWPIRGQNEAPHRLPAETWATRTQQELVASDLPSRSQWNWTFTRPNLSVKTSCPFGPTTTADCVPATTGLGVERAGRNGTPNGISVKVLSYVNPSP